MKKSLLRALIDSYDRKPPREGYPFFEGLQKGLFKHHTGGRTKGMNDLAIFLEQRLQKLNDNDDLSIELLDKLLDIIDLRHQRILNTSRDNFNEPEKATNRVFNILENHLWLEMYRLETQTPDNTIHKLNRFKYILFCHKRDYFLRDLEKNFATYKLEHQAEEFRILGQAMASKRSYKPYLNHDLKDFYSKYGSHLIKYKFKLDKLNTLCIQIKLGDEDRIECTSITITGINFNHDCYKVKGLQYLHRATELGSQTAAYTLAQVYAQDEPTIPHEFDMNKAMDYLKLSAQLGNEVAIDLLKQGGKLGKIAIDPLTSPFDDLVDIAKEKLGFQKP